MRYKCTLMYDGTNFHGSQVQNDFNKNKDNLRTVQLEIENVLKIICKSNVRIHLASRTDAKVHALAQVFHFDTEIVMKEWNMKNAINSRLPNDIYVKEVEIVSDNFHSRFSALKKEYQYIIDLNEYNPLLANYRYYYRHKLDIELMKEASKIFIGEHDFKSFTKNHKIENTIRNIEKIDLDISSGVIRINFLGNGFLHNMVRIIVAMLIEVGNHKKTIEDLKLIMESKDRKCAPKTAPAQGLYLVKVYY